MALVFVPIEAIACSGGGTPRSRDRGVGRVVWCHNAQCSVRVRSATPRHSLDVFGTEEHAPTFSVSLSHWQAPSLTAPTRRPPDSRSPAKVQAAQHDRLAASQAEGGEDADGQWSWASWSSRSLLAVRVGGFEISGRSVMHHHRLLLTTRHNA